MSLRPTHSRVLMANRRNVGIFLPVGATAAGTAKTVEGADVAPKAGSKAGSKGKSKSG